MANTVKLDQFLEELEATEALDGLQKIIVSLRRAFGVDHLVYHWVGGDNQYGCGTYSVEWVKHYVSQNYVRIDPVVAGCLQQFQPVDWKLLDWSSRAARDFRADAVAHGVGNQGYSIPIRGPNGQFALFTATHTCDDATWREFSEANGRDLMLVAHYFNRKALELEPGRKPDQPSALSPRELDAMTLLAMGYSRAQVAAALSISQHTLRVYIEGARLKLGAQNTTHAVARAIGRGLIVV